MPDLKLGRLPNRTRGKLVLDLWAELDDDLKAYAALHSRQYGEEVAAADLAPYILAEFLAGDREFQKALKASKAPIGGR